MIEYVLISTPSALALALTAPVGLTLNPKIIQPLLALARTISDSVIPPTAAWTTFTFTSSFAIFSKEPFNSF